MQIQFGFYMVEYQAVKKPEHREHNSPRTPEAYQKKLLRDLYAALNLESEFNPQLTVKDLKGKIVYQLLSFKDSNTPNFNQNDRFDINHQDANAIGQFYVRLVEHLQAGEVLHLRFIRRGGRSSDNPMIYIRSLEELKKQWDDFLQKDYFTGGSGEEFSWDECARVDIFYQGAADEMTMTGFSETGLSETGFLKRDPQESVETAFGGGLRMQLNRVNPETRGLIFKVEGVFGDLGGRALSREGDLYRDQAFVSMEIEAQINFETLSLEVEKTDADSGDVRDFMRNLVSEILENNGDEALKLFIALLEVNPSLRDNSLEIAFSVQNGENKFKVTSFDGLCTSLDWLITDKLEKDQVGELIANGRPRRERMRDSACDDRMRKILMEEIFENYRQKRLVEDCKIQQIVIENLNQEKKFTFFKKFIIDLLKRKSDFSQELMQQIQTKIKIDDEANSTVLRFGHLLEQLVRGRQLSEWTELFKNPMLELYLRRVGNNQFIYLNLIGQEMAFWVKDGQLVNVADLFSNSSNYYQDRGKSLRRELKQLLGVKLPKAMMNYTRQGD